MMHKKNEYLVNLFQQQPDVPMEELKHDTKVSLQLLMDRVGRRKDKKFSS